MNPKLRAVIPILGPRTNLIEDRETLKSEPYVFYGRLVQGLRKSLVLVRLNFKCDNADIGQAVKMGGHHFGSVLIELLKILDFLSKSIQAKKSADRAMKSVTRLQAITH